MNFVAGIESENIDYPIKRVKSLYPKAIDREIQNDWIVEWSVDLECRRYGITGLLPIVSSIEGTIDVVFDDSVSLVNEELKITITDNIEYKFEYEDNLRKISLLLYPISVNVGDDGKAIVTFVV